MNKIIIANWKMNGSDAIVADYIQLIPNSYRRNFIVCPPTIFLKELSDHFIVGAQDCSAVDKSYGAFTGEVSANMLYDAGTKYVIIGHSERRALGESDEILLKKLNNICNSKMIPIFCIGETKCERDAGNALKILSKQLDVLNHSYSSEVIIAYEPVWSIGHGIIPTSDDINLAIEYIKNYCFSFNKLVEKKIKVLYGGSVNKNNINNLLLTDADGFLIGGAALVAEDVDFMLNRLFSGDMHG